MKEEPRNLVPDQQRSKFIDFIIKETADYFCADIFDILHGGKKEHYKNIRFVIMYLTREFNPSISYLSIGRHLNHKEHTNVMKGVARIKEILEMPKINKSLNEKVIDLKRVIGIKLTNLQNASNDEEELINLEALMYLNLHNLHDNY